MSDATAYAGAEDGAEEPGGSPGEATRKLVDLLDLERLDTDLFRGTQPDTVRQRVYGGQVAAQALIAAMRTVEEGMHPHSLHSYFLLPGDYNVPIIYDVERIRDGKSFVTRRVLARQHGRAIYYQTVSFQRLEEGLEHQDVMPEVKAPEEGMDLVELMTQRGADDGLGREWAALDVRWLGNSAFGLEPDAMHPSRTQVWIRVAGQLSDDVSEHLAMFAYASDVSLLGAALSAHPETGPTKVQMASLDHTIWFHRPFRADEWWLYDQWSPSASGARGLALGRIFTQDGTLVATVAQEGLIRPRPDKPQQY
ncbi:acyl-CoA thioesterase II [Nocardioides sp. zg-ZUI104]|uniref:acyl-CoA thioesterase n=1 Tax=Nocardioides faecalis TaxID=2803858 RepID=UPI001BCA8BE9|nr:acyl-CoA thioesterase II [Nocardioides faecalis]MBS4754348.1 acyl-CoA thioesterase II [Nocardioides faecalis]